MTKRTTDASSHSILIVEDKEVTLKRIANIILSEPNFRLLGTATNINQARQLLGNTSPDVLLTDLQLPDGNGIELIREYSSSTTRSMVLTILGDETSLVNALKAGASGYLMKDDEDEDIIKSIFKLLDGQSPISPSIARHLLKYFATNKSNNEAEVKSNTLLTDRENDVLTMVAKGYTYSEIAKAYELSVHTIASHVKNIYKKLNVNSRGEAVYEASQLGLLSDLNMTH